MRRSYVIAGTIAVLAGAWLATGQFPGDGGKGSGVAVANSPVDNAAKAPQPSPAPQSETPPSESNLIRVRVIDSRAQPQPRSIVLRGRTEADRMVEVRAETYGRVIEAPVEEGARVEKGQRIAVLDGGDRAAKLAEARALLKQRDTESEASRKLSEKGFAPKLDLADLAAKRALAAAAVAAMEVEMSYLDITAPFSGILDDRAVEIGRYLQEGDPVSIIVDLDPIIIVGYATEHDVDHLNVGAAAQARLLNGRKVEGRVQFIAGRADEQTRTFRVEVAAPNADFTIREGLSAELALPTSDIAAHRVSPSVLTLGENGELGVKLVDSENKVQFTPVQILKEDPEGLWIAGPPEQAQIISVGQDFVVAGQTVVPVRAGDAQP